jgi:GR25 family glycosyltransferase involved in LPS biosynthesis
MDLDGYYINLDRSPERRSSMDIQLRDFGLANLVSRFVALDGHSEGPFRSKLENAIHACRQSHELVLSQSTPHAATLILEDDVEISSTLANVIHNGEIRRHLENTPAIDILFLDCAPMWAATPKLILLAERAKTSDAQSDDLIPNLSEPRTIFMIDSKDVYAHCAAAYVVTPQGKKKLENLFSDANHKNWPIDQLYRKLVQEGSIVSELVVPFLATPRLDLKSSMVSPDEAHGGELMDKEESFWAAATRRLLFAGAHGLNLTSLAEDLSKALPPTSREYDLVLRIFGRMMLKG